MMYESLDDLNSKRKPTDSQLIMSEYNPIYSSMKKAASCIEAAKSVNACLMMLIY